MDMVELTKYIEGFTAAGLVALFFLIIGFKNSLKREIVDPEITALKKEIKQMKEEFEKELEAVKQDNQKMSVKIDKKFDEINDKLDRNSQAVSNIQGMITVIFNGVRNTQYEQ